MYQNMNWLNNTSLDYGYGCFRVHCYLTGLLSIVLCYTMWYRIAYIYYIYLLANFLMYKYHTKAPSAMKQEIGNLKQCYFLGAYIHTSIKTINYIFCGCFEWRKSSWMEHVLTAITTLVPHREISYYSFMPYAAKSTY